MANHTSLTLSFSTACFAVLGLLGCRGDPARIGNVDVIIEHVTVLDGRGGAPILDASITIAKGRIIRVASSAFVAAHGATRINGRGKFLLPGFIDMHAHLLFPRCVAEESVSRFDRPLSERALARHLDFGITTIRSPSAPTLEGLRLRNDLNEGQVRGPRAFASAELINDAAMTEAELRAAVREALPARPDYIKAYARLGPHQVASVVDEAHRHGIPVIGHLQQTSWMQGLDAGVDHFAHSVDWSAASLPIAARSAYALAQIKRRGFRARIDWLEAFDPHAPAHDRLLALLAQKQISVDVTLSAYDGKFSPAGEASGRATPSLNAFPELRTDWSRCNDATKSWTAEDFRRWRAAWPRLLTWIKRMHDSGVLLVTGTDLTNEWVLPGEGLHREFELLTTAGLTPNQILRMTGANAAKALRRNDIGIIEPGRRADIVLLAADPRQDIRNTRSIVWVMQGGRRISNGPPR
jgi:imidazolonepropionase-like amidohydrolase